MAKGAIRGGRARGAGTRRPRDQAGHASSVRCNATAGAEEPAVSDVLRGTSTSTQDFADSELATPASAFLEVPAPPSSLPLQYDARKIADFWRRRPVQVAGRILTLSRTAGGLLARTLFDRATNRLPSTANTRIKELRLVLTELGPTYIKLGQALSIRPDLLSPTAMNELQQLCDKCPKYSNETAMELLESELHCRWSDNFSELGSEPIAAASLGQVYMGRLQRSGEKVAVKIQRPGVLETVSLDLAIIRKICQALKALNLSNTDFVALLDEWAMRFWDELDYKTEANYGNEFGDALQRNLPQVVIPRAYAEFTSRKVLTLQWIDGEKLSESKAENVGSLVGTGVIAYLTQLLELNSFHADPHPGNLIRTESGQLAILDFGLMTQINEDIKLGIMEALAHLLRKDYRAIAQDFVTLNFLPSGVDTEPLVPAFETIFENAVQGGGVRNINFQETSQALANVIGGDAPFEIPSYFAIVIRAISVLEGIALKGDPSFSIIDETLPYVSRRLLTDSNPRVQALLRYMVIDESGKSIDADRVIELLRNFETYQEVQRNSSDGVATTARSVAQRTSDAEQTRDALRFVCSNEGATFRNFLVNEVVKGIDGLTREGARELLYSLRLEWVNVPVFLPFAIRPLPLMPSVTEEDRRTVENISKLVKFFAGTYEQGVPEQQQQQQLAAPLAAPFTNGNGNNNSNGNGNLNGESSGQPPRMSMPSQAVLQEVLPIMPEVLGQLVPEIATKLGSRVSARLVRDIFAAGRQTSMFALQSQNGSSV